MLFCTHITHQFLKISGSNSWQHFLQVHFEHLHNLSMGSGTSDRSQEKLPIHRRKVINVDCFTSGMLYPRLVHNGPSYRVLGGLARIYILNSQKHTPSTRREKKQQSCYSYSDQKIRRMNNCSYNHLLVQYWKRCGCRRWLLLLGISFSSFLLLWNLQRVPHMFVHLDFFP